MQDWRARIKDRSLIIFNFDLDSFLFVNSINICLKIRPGEMELGMMKNNFVSGHFIK